MAEEEVTGTEEAAAAEQPQQQFSMQRVYLKDLSFEVPSAPSVFKQEWKPSINVDLRTTSNDLAGGNYEAVLTITITAKLGEETAFLVEVQQAGIFFIANVEGEELRRVLAIVCPNMLFPYAREVIDNTVTRGTFPALMLAQVNFEGLFLSAMQQAEQKAGEEGESAAEAPASDETAS